MSLLAKVEIIGEFKKLTAATKGAQSDLKKLNSKVTTFSNSMNSALSTVGLGLGFGAIFSGLKDATKAAADDLKAQRLLAAQIKRSTKATDKEVEGVEDYINATQIKTGIIDDELRPAYATAVRYTKDLSKAQDILNIATDVSAGTGKDLTLVVKSIARAYDGNVSGLQKLVPGIDKGKDAMEQLKEMFAGTAEEAALADPYQRVEIVFNDLQEKIGMELLPELEKVAEWLNSDEGSTYLDSMFTDFKNIMATVKEVIDGIKTIAKLLQGGWGVQEITPGDGFPTFKLPKLNIQAPGVLPGSTITNNYSVNTKSNANGAEIIAAIKRYERQNGRRYLTA